MSAIVYCEPCRLQGHLCEVPPEMVIEGVTPTCAFCDDGEPCPRGRQQTSLTTPNVLSGDRVKTRVHAGELIERVDPPTSRKRKPASGHQPLATEPTPPTLQEKTMKRTCRECGDPVHALSREDLCKKHNKARREAARSNKNGTQPAGGRSAMPRKPGRPAKAAPPSAHADRTVASLLVSEEQLNRMFLNWPLEDKVIAVQAFLERDAAAS